MKHIEGRRSTKDAELDSDELSDSPDEERHRGA